jgi:hypothetical protein
MFYIVSVAIFLLGLNSMISNFEQKCGQKIDGQREINSEKLKSKLGIYKYITIENDDAIFHKNYKISNPQKIFEIPTIGEFEKGANTYYKIYNNKNSKLLIHWMKSEKSLIKSYGSIQYNGIKFEKISNVKC